MELSEARATAARQKADRVALAAAAKVNDLDQEETPESIMLSSMTAEGGKDRTDREVVVPWLKFLWENYRAILELLHKNAKLERIYHKTAEKAFKFCLDYQRNLEFRRLCEMLRQQFTNLQRMTAQPRNSARIAWEWTPESIELHLHTRFVQLEVATTLELWNEGFQTVEDIYEIMILGKQTPKKKLMASYYEKLTKIFWVADNQLFHAYAWFRHFSLSCEYRKDLKAEEKSMMATSVLLSALSIPSLRDNTDPAALLEEGTTFTYYS
jgi:translation initiation factor 3 subunit A